MRLFRSHVLLLCLALFASSAWAQTETRVMVRAVSKDAKLIGSKVGGARIVIQDALTGAVLAEGVQEGGTGETQTIIVDPVARGETVYDTEGAAGFLATVPLTEPTMVDISAVAPLNGAGLLPRASKRLLLVPGRDVLGEGVILELNGFTVALISPDPTGVVLDDPSLEVTASVTMLCGCPTEPGGLWNADAYEITARIVRDGETVAEAPLAFAGEVNIYTGRLALPETGPYTLQVLAADPETGNFGMAEQDVFRVR